MNPREVSKELRLVQEKHKNDFTLICHELLQSALHKADLLMYVVKNKKKLNSVYGKSNF